MTEVKPSERPVVEPGAAEARPLAIWLFFVAALVVAMVILGGATRLTHSGLSMVDWQPLMGILPPIGDAAWAESFQAYRQFPEYQKINMGMTVDEYKSIFYYEYTHRLLGRVIGIAFAVPFFWFLFRGRVPSGYKLKFAGLLILGGLQGLLGWYMVMSGLVDRPDVSHYRLTAHLALAFIVMAGLVWVGLDMLRGRPLPAKRKFRLGYVHFAGLIFIQSMLGGLVAGSDAGFIYNTWPLMDGAIIPDGLFSMSPWAINFVENVMTMQFVHRIVAYLAFVMMIMLWVKARRGEERSWLVDLLAISVLIQILLGIGTLVMVVPVLLASLHQAGALLVFSIAVVIGHGTERPGSVS